MTRTPNDIAGAELPALRQAIAELPDNARGDFRRLVILLLLVDSKPRERALALDMLRTVYFQRVRADA